MTKRKFDSLKNLGLFPKIFLTLLGLVILPVFIMTIVNYQVSRQNLEREVSMANLDTLRQTRTAVDSILEATESVSLQLAGSQQTKKFWENRYNTGTYKDLSEIKDLLELADTIQGGAPYVKKISLYSFLNNIMLSTGSGDLVHLDGIAVEEIARSSVVKGDRIWIVPGEKDITGKEAETVQLLKFFYNHGLQPSGFILIELKNSELLKLINQIYLRKTGQIFLIDSKGKLVLNQYTNQDIDVDFAIHSGWVEGTEGFKQVDINGKNMLLSYTNSHYADWWFTALLPTYEIDTKVYLIRNALAVVLIIFLGISVFLAHSVTKGIYNPIQLIDAILSGRDASEKKLDKLKNRKDELGKINREIGNIITQLSNEKFLNENITEQNYLLKSKLDDNISSLKNYFLYRLICGDISDENEVQRQAGFLNIPLDSTFMVTILDFDKRPEDVGFLDGGQNEAVRKGILDIYEKAISKVAKPIKVFFETNDNICRIIGILRIDEKPIEFELQALKQMCHFVQNIIHDKFGFTVTIVGGRPEDGLRNLKASYDEAVQALKYKFIMGANSVIFKGDIEEGTLAKPQQYYYKKHLKNCLNTRNIENIEKLLQGFKDNLKEDAVFSHEYIYYSKDVINIILEFLIEDNSISPRYIEELNSAFINFESKFNNIDQTFAWITEYVVRALNAGEQTKPSTVSRYVKEILGIIEKEYHLDLSLSYIAEKLVVSESYISTIFKEETGKNFKDFLTEYKLEKAKELLRETGLSVNEIVKRVGYNSPNHFSRVFKKYEGITAQKYREAYGKKI